MMRPKPRLAMKMAKKKFKKGMKVKIAKQTKPIIKKRNRFSFFILNNPDRYCPSIVTPRTLVIKNMGMIARRSTTVRGRVITSNAETTISAGYINSGIKPYKEVNQNLSFGL